MRELSVRGKSGVSRIYCGAPIASLGTLIDASRTLVVTDAKVNSIYGRQFPPSPVVEVGRGEGSKNIEGAAAVWDALFELEADRSWSVLGIGGGVVCDMAGFAASTYLRGLPFAFAPTTLLAQVDAASGGKNGVNFRGLKNLVGTFKQPGFVLCDPSVLASLTEREFKSGFGEAVKHAVIASAEYFEMLESAKTKALSHDASVLEEIVFRSIMIKSGIVSSDEEESGPRMVLNLGHTIGHGIEALAGILHGEAVSVGMSAACELAERKGLLPAAETSRIRALLAAYGLPVWLSEVVFSRAERFGLADKLMNAIRHDKKRAGDFLRFVLPVGIGSVIIDQIPFDQLETFMREFAA